LCKKLFLKKAWVGSKSINGAHINHALVKHKSSVDAKYVS